jgi:hypothetical protein
VPIAEAEVEKLVSEVSERMKDPQYTQLAVGSFVESQPELARYLSAKGARIGGAQSVVELAFHAELLCECLRRDLASELPVISLRKLDVASQGDTTGRLTELEPALASYIASNLDDEKLKLELSRICLALVIGTR